MSTGVMVLYSRLAPKAGADGQYSVALDEDYRKLLQSAEFENNVPYMYLDSVGKVTVGAGKMLGSAREAEAIKFVHRAKKQPATAAEVGEAFGKVKAAHAKMVFTKYQTVTDLDLAPGEADRLLDVELKKAEDGCRQLFSGWATFPYPAKLALLDMTYNMGEGRALSAAETAANQKPGANKVKEHGLYQYHKLREAAAKGNWSAAAAGCHRHGPNEPRNTWTRNKFLEAAKLAPPVPEPHKALNLG